MILQLFDAHGNHVQENTKVELRVDGFRWLKRSSGKKVDACGCIDLGGFLKVSEGYYGKSGIIQEMPILL